MVHKFPRTYNNAAVLDNVETVEDVFRLSNGVLQFGVGIGVEMGEARSGSFEGLYFALYEFCPTQRPHRICSGQTTTSRRKVNQQVEGGRLYGDSSRPNRTSRPKLPSERTDWNRLDWIKIKELLDQTGASQQASASRFKARRPVLRVLFLRFHRLTGTWQSGIASVLCVKAMCSRYSSSCDFLRQGPHLITGHIHCKHSRDMKGATLCSCGLIY